MSRPTEQTWWDDNLPTQFNSFVGWVGASDTPSKVYARNIIKTAGYKSLIDIGCGNATEFFAYKEEYPELMYMGLDSSNYLLNYNVQRGVPMIKEPAHATKLNDNEFEVAYARHVLEHQEFFQPILSEMIRVGSKLAMHIFFIKPQPGAPINNYNGPDNLYHQTFDKTEIENFLDANPKVNTYTWDIIDSGDEALIIALNDEPLP